MLEKIVGWVEKIFSMFSGVSTWIMDFVSKYASQLLLIGIILAVAKMFKLNIKI